jgi:regulator of protease activity HflC (stomatin/prohibitin superfamily)
MYKTNEGNLNIAKIVKHVVITLVAIVLVFGTFGSVGAGEKGVRTRFSAVVGTVNQGLYVKIPFVETVHKMSIKTQTINYDKSGDVGDNKVTDTNLFGASKDLQDVAIGVVVNYHIDALKVQDIFSQYSSVENYQANVIEPMIREIVKSVSAQYTAEELVTKRAEFSDKVNVTLATQFLEKNAIMERFSVTNFQFSTAFSQAIESKVTAVQNAEAQKNKLEQVKYEAQQTIETAKATAEAQRISAQALAAQGGADYVALKAIEKWNGILPVSMIPGSSVPFINVK